MKFVKAKIQYEKVNEDGSQAMVNESYLVDAMSFTEAEARITEEMAPFINGEFECVINYDNYDKAIAVLAKMVLQHEGN